MSHVKVPPRELRIRYRRLSLGRAGGFSTAATLDKLPGGKWSDSRGVGWEE
jgi:hypothetical protein